MVFAILDPHEQWQIHAFYQPDQDWTDEQLYKYWRLISKEQPSLPNRTGKLFRGLDRAFRLAFEYSGGDEQRFMAAIQAQVTSPVSTHGERRTKVYGVVRPQIDTKRIAKVVMEIAKEIDANSTQEPEA